MINDSTRIKRLAQRFGRVVGGAALATTLVGASAMAEVTIRIASDTVGPPHPAGIAMEIFKEKVEQAIPGSKVRIYVSSSLYKIP
nr:hypothetical protein [uncultured Brevundimonas sp.]